MQKEGIQQAKISIKKSCQTHSKYRVTKQLKFKKKKNSIAKVGHYKSQGFKPFFLLYFKTVKQLLRKCCTTVAFLPLFTTVISMDRLVESADFGCC